MSHVTGGGGRRRRLGRLGALVALMAGVAYLAAFAGAGVQAGAARPLRILATTTQVADLARNVAGTTAVVDGILPANVDPLDYQPGPGDMDKIALADVVLVNGVGMEDAWITKLLLRVPRRHGRVVDASRGVTLLPGTEETPKGDPHIWFAVPNAVQMVANIENAVALLDTLHAEDYQANAAQYIQQLDALDKYIIDRIGTLAPVRRKIVTSHDAFRYYATRYQLTLVGTVIPSASLRVEPSAEHLAELVGQIQSEHVKAIFLENSVDPALAEEIAHEAGVRVITGLYGDTLGPAGSPADTYITMMRYDTDLIVSGLR
jgi:manganese/iron transport system substrate-binding protein